MIHGSLNGAVPAVALGLVLSLESMGLLVDDKREFGGFWSLIDFSDVGLLRVSKMTSGG